MKKKMLLKPKLDKLKIMKIHLLLVKLKLVFTWSKIRTFDPTIFKCIKNWFLKRIMSIFV